MIESPPWMVSGEGIWSVLEYEKTVKKERVARLRGGVV